MFWLVVVLYLLGAVELWLSCKKDISRKGWLLVASVVWPLTTVALVCLVISKREGKGE